MKVLLIEDEKLTRITLTDTLSREGYDVASCPDGAEGMNTLKEREFDTIITDLRLPGVSGMDILREARFRLPDCHVIMMTAYATVDTAVEALKLGAYDYIAKPFSPDDLLHKLAHIRRLRETLTENTKLRRRIHILENRPIIGSAPATRNLLNTLSVVATRDCTVLLQGESGTGKELAARSIHEMSPRKGRPYVPVNCAVIPESLLESELFGHEKGAFSGAVGRHTGYFERANQGTLFIDDVDDLPFPIQVKLLRVLQERQFERIGGRGPTHVDIRVICATKVDLRTLTAAGKFREDLYYRLNIVPVIIPPLRERSDDIPLLVEHFLYKYDASQSARHRLEERMDDLRHNRWPGNVRELENVVQRVVALPGIPDLGIESDSRPPASSAGATPLQADQPGDAPTSYEAYMEKVDREILVDALRRASGNVSVAAQLLCLPRSTFRSKLEKYSISEG